jgi:hypothetical protein
MILGGLAVQEMDPAQWAALVFGILLCVWLIYRPWRKGKDPLNKPIFKTSLAQQRALERQMSNLVVEMSEMARQITAQLDTRAAKLELLIKEADEKIARLDQANGSTNGNGASAVSIDARERSAGISRLEAVPPDPQLHADPRHAQVYRLADEGRSSQQIAQELHRPSGEIELILALRPRG